MTAIFEKTAEFNRGSSPMREADALGHVADKLGEITDALKALARQGGVRGKTVRQTMAHLVHNCTMARDATRGVAHLRGNTNWLIFVKMIEQMTDHATALLTLPRATAEWPSEHFMELAKRFDVVMARIKALKDARENRSVGMTKGGVILPIR